MTIPVLIGILIFAHGIETILGFGSTVIAIALGGLVAPIGTLVQAFVILGFGQASWILVREWRHINWPRLWREVFPACISGTLLGFGLHAYVSERALRIGVGTVVTLLALAQLYALIRGKRSGKLSKPVGLGFLVAGGIMHGLFATGGPLIIYYAQRSLGAPAAIRASLATLWIVLNTSVMINFYRQGLLTEASFDMAIYLIPGLLGGLVAGSLIKTTERGYQLLAYCVLAFCGLVLALG